MGGLINRTRGRSSSEEQEPVEVTADADPDACCLIKDQPDRCMANLHGTLRSVEQRPIDGVTALEAELYDGSEPLTLIWLGRETIEGIEAGRTLTVHGRVGRRGQERVLYNPRYELDA
ncbi:MAG TPA: OB-fold nucleic acid binding domain-containing protein [Aeromicrobium sp.]|jgi:hypothetical protein|nr:OB-fold nucleic acid binding domain-containing protein [Aeromicrobium sp.]